VVNHDADSGRVPDMGVRTFEASERAVLSLSPRDVFGDRASSSSPCGNCMEEPSEP
jgi:hypothetical protein